MEDRFGHDFSQVRIHVGAAAADSARSLRALAYTVGPHIVFGPGQYRPRVPEGDRLIAHELAHVIQQANGEAAAPQRQADEGEQLNTPEEPAREDTDEDGYGVETEESSTEDEPQTIEDTEDETAVVQSKPEGIAAEAEPAHLEQEANRAADDAFAGRSVRVTMGSAATAPLRAPAPAGPTRCGRPDTRVADFPQTFISRVNVDLTSPNQTVTLSWTGPSAGSQPTGPFHSSPGAGCCSLDCDDTATSRRGKSHCTPTGNWTVHGHSCHMSAFPEARNVTWFGRNGVALHFYPSVPNWPASHGCVRLERDASRIIYDNTLADKTTVAVGGTWTRHPGTCWACGAGRKRPGR